MEATCGLSLGSLNSGNSINRLDLSTPETRNEIFLLGDCTTLPCVLGLRSPRYSKCIICNMILHCRYRVRVRRSRSTWCMRYAVMALPQLSARPLVTS